MSTTLAAASPPASTSPAWQWRPQRVVVTSDALAHAHGRDIVARCEALGLDIEQSRGNRLPRLGGADDRETYRTAKSTLAIVTAPPSKRRLQPIPPSADWQFHLAQGCPAHCQYCYLAGSLQGPPVVRAYANLGEILDASRPHDGTADAPATFEVSCYTDPLGIEHLTGSLSGGDHRHRQAPRGAAAGP